MQVEHEIVRAHYWNLSDDLTPGYILLKLLDVLMLVPVECYFVILVWFVVAHVLVAQVVVDEENRIRASLVSVTYVACLGVVNRAYYVLSSLHLQSSFLRRQLHVLLVSQFRVELVYVYLLWRASLLVIGSVLGHRTLVELALLLRPL